MPTVSVSQPQRRRTALFLVVMLMPFLAGPALAGLVVCAGSGGVSTSWARNSDCPKRMVNKLAAEVQGLEQERASRACVVLETPDAATQSTRPASSDLPATDDPGSPVVSAEPVSNTHVELIAKRGPPAGLSSLLRSVVLRI